jgi:hypothetical protein
MDLNGATAYMQTVLDNGAWMKATAEVQQRALDTAERNMKRWYRSYQDYHVYEQALWELQGIDPSIVIGRQGVTFVSQPGVGSISLGKRGQVAPVVLEELGRPLTTRLAGGRLV